MGAKTWHRAGCNMAGCPHTPISASARAWNSLVPQAACGKHFVLRSPRIQLQPPSFRRLHLGQAELPPYLSSSPFHMLPLRQPADKGGRGCAMQILATSPLCRVLCCPWTAAGARSSQLCLETHSTELLFITEVKNNPHPRKGLKGSSPSRFASIHLHIN